MNSAGRAVIPGRALAAVLAIVFAGVACNQPTQTAAKSDVARPAPAASRNSGPARDLSQDESAGGHTLRKHVGRTDDQLRERLRHERNISAASTWTDRDTAERAVGTALEQDRDRIDRWLSREGGHPNLLINYDGDASHPIGRSLPHR
jgi:hypothetical protein